MGILDKLETYLTEKVSKVKIELPFPDELKADLKKHKKVTMKDTNKTAPSGDSIVVLSGDKKDLIKFLKDTGFDHYLDDVK